MPYTLKEFESVWPSLVDDLTAHAKQYNLPPSYIEWYEKVSKYEAAGHPWTFHIPPPPSSHTSTDRPSSTQSLNYNTLGGKANRGISVLDTTALLSSTTPNASLSASAFHAAATLGWLTELLQAFFLVSDDMMDASPTRRGQPCWYRIPAVGLVAINDAFMLEASIFLLLKKHFRTHPSYVAMMELFHEVSFQTEIGQLCDLLTAPEDTVDLANFSMAKFDFIVVHKTAYYSFYLPVALALHYLGLATDANLRQARDILVPLGEYFQAQDDYLDCFGSPETIGKVGTDIQDNKCSWLINQALLRASPAQRKLLEENYGRKDKGMETKCKAVYRELQLEDVYKRFEEKRVGEIREMIARVDEGEGLKREVFETFLMKIYKRSK
ncbi:Farnesyl pyrophosphate synthetase [Ptychographa xylographoides]|nr:Farnesyl pyrophosphate synthetase [Ptychographa xylographoides]